MMAAVRSHPSSIALVRWLMWPRVALTAAIVAFALLGVRVWWLIEHRAPPFAMDMLDYIPPEGAPGEFIVLRTPARRDLERGCSAEYTAELLLSNGTYRRLWSGEMSADAIARREALTPGRLDETFAIPATGVPPGWTELLYDIRYTCLSNPTTWVFPISVTTARRFFVHPPRQVEQIIIQAK